MIFMYTVCVALSSQPAGPAAEYSKSCEDMYDEIVELKKVPNVP